MQSIRFILSRTSVSLLSESKLIHSPPVIYIDAAKRLSPTISYFYQRTFHSRDQLPEEEDDNAGARAWALCNLTSEKIVDRPESGKGADSSHPAEESVPLKEKLEVIERTVEDSSDKGGKTEAWIVQNRLPSRAGRRAGGKKSREKSAWVCTECGENHGKWWGVCPSCKTSGSLRRFVDSNSKGVWDFGKEPLKPAVPQRLIDVTTGMNQSEWRIPLGGHLGMEVARVLGGGLVPGSLVLLGGDPGVGKSTLLLQIAAIITQDCNSSSPSPVLYVSGEESLNQIGNRAERLRITSENLYLYSSTEVEDILDKVQNLCPAALIVDSIHTIYLRDVIGSAGNIAQVKECTLKLLHFAKQTSVPVLLIGHVTKTGDIAGPHMLEHMVDVVLYMEGERCSSYRLLRSVKNRFGTTDELGLLEMTESGIQAVSNPSEMFLSGNYSDSNILAGLALAIVVDGSRAFIIEIQALCVSASSGSKHVNGIPESRADMIISVLMKQAGLKLQDNAVFLNVASGFKLTETAGDLAIAAAICSSLLESPIPHGVAFIGEVGLGGDLRTVQMMEKRVSAAANLGFKRCIVPMSAVKGLSALNLNIQIIGSKDLKGVISTVFTTP
ncbi:hypothetical protein KSP40_PGU007897 [Platanthera guangdongensis]|uniref:RecA family profile 1 domain-containing protein n=1 Tax=Platanthera guangdongensis TaxID=2320717 RepID=A0ABR2LZ57_9ASPA